MVTNGNQPVYIYDTDKGKTYAFDGVTKIQHDLSLKIEEDTSSKKGKDIVNNAQNEPDEITMEVVMSNVYSTQSDITQSNDDRAKGALATLMELKKARRKVQVITYFATYNNMLLQDITITQDESNHFGWTGQLTFKEATSSSTGSATSTIGTSSVTVASGGRTPSIWVSWFGANCI